MSSVGTDSYTLKMIDAITAPLKQIQGQIERTNEALDKLTQATGLQNLTNMVSLAKAGFGALTTVVGGFVSVVEKGVGMLADFGKEVLKIAQFRTQNIQALEVFLGKGKGEGIFNRALDVGGITPADELEVVKQVRELSAAGYKGRDLSETNAALLDVHAMLGQENSDQLRYYFQKFKGATQVEADDLRRAAQLSGFDGGEAGLKARLVKNATGKDLTGAAMEKQFAALKKQGRITGQDIAYALKQGINERLSGGEGLGAAARKMGEGTLSGLMSNLAAAPARFLAQMKLESLPGIQSLMNFIKRLLVFFDHATEQGRQLTKVVEDLTNALFGGLDTLDADDLQRFFGAGVEAATKLVEVVKEAWGFVDKLLHGDWTDMGKGLLDALGAIAEFLGGAIYKGVLAAMKGGDPGKSFADWQFSRKFHAERKESDRRVEQQVDALMNPPAAPGTAAWWVERHKYDKPSKGQPAAKPAEISGLDYLRRHGGQGYGSDAPLKAGEEGGRDLIRGHMKGVSDEADMNSPSKETEEQGRNLVRGLLIGLRSAAERLEHVQGEEGELEMALVRVLRGMALRTGAPLAAGAG